MAKSITPKKNLFDAGEVQESKNLVTKSEVDLNFKVSPDFRLMFKQAALSENMKMKEFIVKVFEFYQANK